MEKDRLEQEQNERAKIDIAETEDEDMQVPEDEEILVNKIVESPTKKEKRSDTQQPQVIKHEEIV